MQYGKFTHVLALLATIPMPVMGKHPTFGYGMNVAMTTEEACVTFDHLFEYIHANFALPFTTGRNDIDGREELQNRWNTPEGKKEIADCDAMLCNKNCTVAQFVQLLETIPPYFNEVLFPVCVARYMFRELNMPINHRQTTQFKEFHDRYGTMILG